MSSTKSSNISSINSSSSSSPVFQSSTVQHQKSSGSYLSAKGAFQASNNKCSRLSTDTQTAKTLGVSPSSTPKLACQDPHDSESNVYSLLWMSSSSAAPEQVVSSRVPSLMHTNVSNRSVPWFQQSTNRTISPSIKAPSPPRDDRMSPNPSQPPSLPSSSSSLPPAPAPHQQQQHVHATTTSLPCQVNDPKHPLTIHLWQVATNLGLVQDPVSHQLMLHMLHVPLIPSIPGPHISTSPQSTLLHHLYSLDCGTKMALRHAVEETLTRYIHCELSSSDPQHPEIHVWLQRLRLFTLQCNQRVDGIPPVTMLSYYITGAQVDPVIAIVNIMKLSFHENHRIAIGWLGGLETLSEVLLSEYRLSQRHPERDMSPSSLLLRRYVCVCLTNLTYHLGENKSSLCSRESWLEALTAQLNASCDELVQTAASVLRNLSWRANEESRLALQRAQCSRRLMLGALRYSSRTTHQSLHISTAKTDVGEHTLKSILSALWNLSAHSTVNKMQIVQVSGAVHFLVSTLTYTGLNHSLAIVESGGGILRNIAPLLVEKHETRELLCQLECVEVLLRQLQSSPSLTVVSNAVGTFLALLSPPSTVAEPHKVCNSNSSTTQTSIPMANVASVTSMTLRPSEWSAMQRLGGISMLHCLMQSKHKLISQAASQVVWHLSSLDPHLYTHYHRRSCPAQWVNVNNVAATNIIQTNLGDATSLSRSVPPGLLENPSTMPTLLNMSGSSSGSLLSQRQQKQWKKEQEEMLLRAASIMSQGNVEEEDKSEGDYSSEEEKNKKDSGLTRNPSFLNTNDESALNHMNCHENDNVTSMNTDPNCHSRTHPRSTYVGQHTYVNIPFDEAFLHSLMLQSNQLSGFPPSNQGSSEMQPHGLQTFLRPEVIQSPQGYDPNFRQERMKVPAIMSQDILGRMSAMGGEGPRVWAIEGSPISGCSVSSDEEDISGASPLSSISEVTEEDEEEAATNEWSNRFYTSNCQGGSDVDRGIGLPSICNYSSGLSPVLESSMEQCEESEIGEDGFTWQTSPQLPQSGRHSGSIRSLLSFTSAAPDKNNEASQNVDYCAPDLYNMANSESQLSHVTSTPSLGDLPDSPCQEDAVDILLAHELRHQHDAQNRINECIHSALPQSSLADADVPTQSLLPSISTSSMRQRHVDNSVYSAQMDSSLAKGEIETPLLWLIPQHPIEKKLPNSSKCSSTTTSKSHTTSDSVRHFALEGTPLQHSSKASSLSELSLPDLIPHPHPRACSPSHCDVNSRISSKLDSDTNSHKPNLITDATDSQMMNNVQLHCVSSDDDDDDEQSSQLLSQVIQSAMPTTRSQSQAVKPAIETEKTFTRMEPHSWTVPFKSKLPLLQTHSTVIHRSYSPANTDRSTTQTNTALHMQNMNIDKKEHNESPSPSVSSKSCSGGPSHDSHFMTAPGWNSLAGAKQTTTPNCLRSVSATSSGSGNGSRGTASFSIPNTCSSLSSLSLESSGIENTLLQECISSAMPAPKAQLAGVTSKLLTPTSDNPKSNNASVPIISGQNSNGTRSVDLLHGSSNTPNQDPRNEIIQDYNHFLVDGSDVTVSHRKTPSSTKLPASLPPSHVSESVNQNHLSSPRNPILNDGLDCDDTTKHHGASNELKHADTMINISSSLSVTSENVTHSTMCTHSHFLMDPDEHAYNCNTSERWLKSLRRSQKSGVDLSMEEDKTHELESCHTNVCGLSISIGPSSSVLSLEISESDLDALVDTLEIDASPEWSGVVSLHNDNNTDMSISNEAMGSLGKMDMSIPTNDRDEAQIASSNTPLKSRLPQLRVSHRRPDRLLSPTSSTPCARFTSPINSKSVSSSLATDTKRVLSSSSLRTSSPAESNSLQVSVKKKNSSVSPSRAIRSPTNNQPRSKTVPPAPSGTAPSTKKSSGGSTKSGTVISSSKRSNSTLKTPVNAAPSSTKQPVTSRAHSAPSPNTLRYTKRPSLPINSPQRSTPLSPSESVPPSPSTLPIIRGGTRVPPPKCVAPQLSPSVTIRPITCAPPTSSSEQESPERRSIRGGRRALTGIRISSANSSSGDQTGAVPSIRIKKAAPPPTQVDEANSLSSSPPSAEEESIVLDVTIDQPITNTAVANIATPSILSRSPLQSQKRLVATVSPSRQVKPPSLPQGTSPLVNDVIPQSVEPQLLKEETSEDDQLIWIHRTEVSPQTVLSRAMRFSESHEEDVTEKSLPVPPTLYVKKPSPLTIKVAPIVQQATEEQDSTKKNYLSSTPTNESSKLPAKPWSVGKFNVEQETTIRVNNTLGMTTTIST